MTKDSRKQAEKPQEPVVFEIPEALVQAVLNYIATSIPQKMTVQEAVNLSMMLQRLKRIDNAAD